MVLAPLPEEILDRFRTSSRARLLQVESTWQALAQGLGTDEKIREMHRNVHTLKGDARMVRFHDIDLLCQKLEDLLSAADSHQYHVSPDFDLVVEMALDFIGLLLRRRGDQEMSGIDLEGFVAQVNQVLRGEVCSARSMAGASLAEEQTQGGADVTDRVSRLTREHLAVAATKVFLEYLSASGTARTRLRSAWSDLQQQIERFDSIPLTALVARHAQAVEELALGLQHEVDLEIDLDSEMRVSADALQALDTALLHGLRNSLSHGVGTPAEREARGQARRGRIRIECRSLADAARIRIIDDGPGIDLERVRARASSSGALHPDLAARASAEELTELLFAPRFSTREQAGEVAGRGLGLDAIRTAVRKVGGQVELRDNRALGGSGEGGTSLVIELPVVRREIEIHAFDAYGGRLVLAVSCDWQTSWRDLKTGKDPIDPIASLQIRRPEDDTGLLASGIPQLLVLESPTGERVELVASSSHRALVAERICPTPSSFPVEVVTVAGAEVLLLRPDKLPAQVHESNEWQA